MTPVPHRYLNSLGMGKPKTLGKPLRWLVLAHCPLQVTGLLALPLLAITQVLCHQLRMSQKMAASI